jgi:hypothetical protein
MRGARRDMQEETDEKARLRKGKNKISDELN